MELQKALDQLLKAYQTYYNINREFPAAPFQAEAEFGVHDEQYFLVHAAKLSEADSREFVYFATCEELTVEYLAELDAKAWDTGSGKAEPKPNHRNTDVSLVVLTNHITKEAAQMARKIRHYKSYRFGLWGWSAYRLIVCDLTSGEIVHNRHGEILKKTISNNLVPVQQA